MSAAFLISACETAHLVKFGVDLDKQFQNIHIELTDNDIKEVLEIIDVIAARYNMIQGDCTRDGTEMMRCRYFWRNYNVQKSQKIVSIHAVVNKEAKSMTILLMDEFRISQSSLSQEIEHELISTLTTYYGEKSVRRIE